ncbi:MAG TPA: hypothetical protein VGG27_14130 [Magnetospirillaceae bacterium]|jgi:hypothetical protein
MTKFTTAAAALGLALVASTSAYAGRAGGPDTMNPIEKTGTPVTQAAQDNAPGYVVVWAGQQRQVQPVVTAEALTGTVNDPTEIVHVGRLAYRVEKPAAGQSEGTAVASSGRLVLING